MLVRSSSELPPSKLSSAAGERLAMLQALGIQAADAVADRSMLKQFVRC